MADGDDLSGSASASGCGDDAKAVVGFGDTENHTGTLKLVLARHLVRSPENGAEHGDCAASGVVPQTSPDLLSDALALVRKELWAHATFRRSLRKPDTVKVPRGHS